MPVTDADTKLYETIKPDLLSRGMEKKWVLIYNGQLVDVYDSYEKAFEASIAKFKESGFIKQVFAKEPVEKI